MSFQYPSSSSQHQPFDGGPNLVQVETDSSLPRQIYYALRQRILIGELKAGQVLKQDDLARQFNISRVPLREALGQLEADGLIESRPRRGYAVVNLNTEEIVELFELRSVIEEHAGRIAAHTRTASDIGDIEADAKAMEALDPADRNFATRWSLLNHSFHLKLIAATHRKRLTRIADNLRSTVYPYVVLESNLTGDVDDANRQHREILAALKAGDSAGLAELCRGHVEDTARRLLKGLHQKAL